jgi:hypothetical protein
MSLPLPLRVKNRPTFSEVVTINTTEFQDTVTKTAIRVLVLLGNVFTLFNSMFRLLPMYGHVVNKRSL